MEATDFCYWLQGFFELSGDKKLTPKQVEIIKDHLQLVFNKVTPNRSVSYELLTDSTAGKPICNTFTEENTSLNDILNGSIRQGKSGRPGAPTVYC
jgi:hypothetical protein